MTEIYWLGPCPSDEQAAQSCDDNFHEANKAECRAFITAIKRVCGEPPEGAVLKIKSSSHDFGSYREVVVEFDDNDQAAAEYAMKCDKDAPTEWSQAGMEAPKTSKRER